MALDVANEYANKYLDGDGLEKVWDLIKKKFALKEHTHGNITSGGTITATAVTVADGDSILIADSSDSGKIAKGSITFDGSTTNKYLSPKGSWETIPSIPTVNDGTLTVTFNGTSLGAFTANQSGNTTVAISAATTGHGHGNITSGGTMSATGVNITSGDALIIMDKSANSGITRTSIEFDGSTTDQFLSKKGTWSDTVAKATSATTAENATSAATAANADTLDNKHASDFALSGHTHQTLTIGSKTYNGGTAVSVTAGDLSAYTKAEIDSMLSGNLKYTSVTTRPTTGESGVVYIIPGEKTGTNNIKEEWMYINGAWEMIGTTETELSGYSKTGHTHDDRYYTKDEIDAEIPAFMNQNAYSVVTVNGGNAMSATTETDSFNLVAGDYITLSGGTKAVKISTNLTFDATPTSTNKVVTLDTINKLDGVISGTPGQGNTLTGFTEENGVVTAKFGAISITKSQISDFPTIPTVNNGTLTIKVNGANAKTFTANQSGNTEVDIAVPTVNRLTETEIAEICV